MTHVAISFSNFRVKSDALKRCYDERRKSFRSFFVVLCLNRVKNYINALKLNLSR